MLSITLCPIQILISELLSTQTISGKTQSDSHGWVLADHIDQVPAAQHRWVISQQALIGQIPRKTAIIKDLNLPWL